MTPRSTFLFLLLFFIIWGCADNSQMSGGGTHGGNPVEFTGVILNEEGNPVQNVEVSLIPAGQVPYSSHAIYFKDSTNAKGEYSIAIAGTQKYESFNLSAVQKDQAMALFRQNVVSHDPEATKIILGENTLSKTGALQISIPHQKSEGKCLNYVYIEGSAFYQQLDTVQTEVLMDGLAPGDFDVRLGTCADVATYSIPLVSSQIQSNDTVSISIGRKTGTKHFVALAGNDTNSGAETHPWASIQYAVEQSQAGDTILVAQGSYPEFVQVNQSGELFSPIVILSGDSAKLAGFELNGNHIVVDGFHFEEMGIDSSELGIVVNGDHVLIQNNTFFDLPSWSIRVGGRNDYSQSVRILANKVIQGGAGFLATGDYLVIADNEFQQLRFKSGQPDAITFFGSNIRIEANIIHGSSREDVSGSATGITAFQTWDNNGEYATNILISRNRVHGVSSCFVLEGRYYGQNLDFVVRNNVCSDVWLYTGIVDEIHNFQLLHNTFYRNDSLGISFKGDGENSKVYNNIFSTVDESFSVENDENYTADYNLYHETVMSQREGVHSYEGDPRFVAVQSNNFSLMSASDAIDKGNDVGVGDDMTGETRPVGDGPDIGAYEYRP